MLLEKLEIHNSNQLIREVVFKTGVNIITDETSTLSTSTGNSIGKTSILRLVDYCLGSDGEDLFKDKEFKNIDEALVKQLGDLQYQVVLKFIVGKTKYSVTRSITNKKEIFLNTDRLTITELKSALEKIIFGISTSKPSIRQLMPKFIRKDNNSMSNTLNFLHSTTKTQDYEMVFLFLFGFIDFESLHVRYQTLNAIKKIKSQLKTVKGLTALPALKQREKVLEGNIKEAEKNIKAFKINEAYAQEFEKLKELRKNISRLSKEKSSEELKLSLSKQTLFEIRQSISNVDVASVKNLYQQAKKFNPELQKSFDDVLAFHNAMVQNKEEFVNRSIDVLQSKITLLDTDLTAIIKEEEKIVKQFSDTGSLSDLQILQKDINSLYETIGQVRTSIRMISSLEENIKKNQEVYDKLSLRIDQYFQDFDIKLAEFNTFFSSFSKQLYKEEFILVYELNENKELKFKIDNITSNEGGGKKKGQVAAFDLAYTHFALERGILGPKFIMHDSIEDVHVNQIETLLKLADQFPNAQYVVAVLRDKIQPLGNDWISQHKIVKLSQTEKLFKLP